jgi:hypothetical protein
VGPPGDAGPGFARTLIVSPFATAAASGTALLNAVTQAGTNAASGNRWLVLIEPGNYDLGSTTLTMPANVDIAGSGRLSTHLVGAVAPVIVGADNVELRDLEVTCSATTQSVAILTAASTSISRVVARVQNVTTESAAILLRAGNATLVDVTASATGAGAVGILIQAGAPSLQHVNVAVQGSTGGGSQVCVGLYAVDNPTVTVTDSTIGVTAMPATEPCVAVSYGFSIPPPPDANAELSFENTDISATGANAVGVGMAATRSCSLMTCPTPARTLVFRGSSITGSFSIVGLPSSVPVVAATADTELSGAISLGANTALICVGDYSANFVPLKDGTADTANAGGFCL